MRDQIATSLVWACAAWWISIPVADSFMVQRRTGQSATPALMKRTVLSETLRIAIVGGGWAGFSAAEVLSSAFDKKSNRTLQIDLLDASPRGPGGLAAGWKSKSNRTVEAGLHGFWREYTNTFAMMEQIGLDLDELLTPYTPSVLVSESGRVALSPVLGSNNAKGEVSGKPSVRINLSNIDSALSSVAELLPPPLDIALLSEFDGKNPLSPQDRLSALGLLALWADFGQEDPESWARYDVISAETLFCAYAGVTKTLYRELVLPLLHVLPMAPGYDCSAAAALSCFHVFALQSRGAFDVRWCRGTISDFIFNPWTARLIDKGNVSVRGASKVTSIDHVFSSGKRRYMLAVNNGIPSEYDGIILAVGGTALKKMLPSCPPLGNSDYGAGWKHFRGAMSDSPVFVCGPRIGNIPQLAETGFCVYDLQRLQDEFKPSSVDENPSFAIEIDFFRADELANIAKDSEVVRLTLDAVAAALSIPPISLSKHDDFSIVRARDAVTHFCLNSASWSPDVKVEMGLYMSGDWIDRTGHASWSTEKAVVTGKQAANQLLWDFGMEGSAEIIKPAQDTPQLSALRRIAKASRALAMSGAIPMAPWR